MAFSMNNLKIGGSVKVFSKNIVDQINYGSIIDSTGSSSDFGSIASSFDPAQTKDFGLVTQPVV